MSNLLVSVLRLCEHEHYKWERAGTKPAVTSAIAGNNQEIYIEHPKFTYKQHNAGLDSLEVARTLTMSSPHALAVRTRRCLTKQSAEEVATRKSE